MRLACQSLVRHGVAQTNVAKSWYDGLDGANGQFRRNCAPLSRHRYRLIIALRMQAGWVVNVREVERISPKEGFQASIKLQKIM